VPSFVAGVIASSVYIGKLFSWGINANGATGLNTTTGNTLVPTQVDNDITWENVSCGFSGAARFSLGIKSGKLFSWGSNANGRTGLNTTTGNTLVPTQVGSDTDWTIVAASPGQSFAIKSGKLFSWGSNANGATGLNTTTGDTLVPTQVGSDTDWEIVSLGNNHGSAIKLGKLFSWGRNDFGATGLNTTTGNTLVPTQVGSDTDWTDVVLNKSNQGMLFAGFGMKSGKLFSWGNNANGATGLNTNVGNTLVPTQVGTDTDWTDVSGSVIGTAMFSLGVKSGKLFSWGSNANGVGGLNTTTGDNFVPTQVGTDTDWTDVDCGTNVSFAIKSGKLFSWGSNANGRTGLNTTTGNTLVPTQVGSEIDWHKVNGGNGFASVLKTS
jgi:alpha-tubulin suppressor-like RCC1 family protein